MLKLLLIMVPNLELVVEPPDADYRNNHASKDLDDEDDNSRVSDLDGDDDDEDDVKFCKRANNITKPGEHDVLLGRGGGTSK